jgi:hypothetical protein
MHSFGLGGNAKPKLRLLFFWESPPTTTCASNEQTPNNARPPLGSGSRSANAKAGNQLGRYVVACYRLGRWCSCCAEGPKPRSAGANAISLVMRGVGATGTRPGGSSKHPCPPHKSNQSSRTTTARRRPGPLDGIALLGTCPSRNCWAMPEQLRQ